MRCCQRTQQGVTMPLRVLVLALTMSITFAFREGDFIPTARKLQISKLRTNWEDLLGLNCPRFGANELTLMDLPKPKRFDGEVQDYKLQFAFNGEQHITPWVTVLGKHAPAVPSIHFTLVRSGDEVRRVHVEVKELPETYRRTHGYLFDMFANASHWPKEALVFYEFQVENDEDIARGLYLLYALGISITAIIAFNSLRSYSSKLRQFLEETAFDDSVISGRASWHVPGKGE